MSTRNKQLGFIGRLRRKAIKTPREKALGELKGSLHMAETRIEEQLADIQRTRANLDQHQLALEKHEGIATRLRRQIRDLETDLFGNVKEGQV